MSDQQERPSARFPKDLSSFSGLTIGLWIFLAITASSLWAGQDAVTVGAVGVAGAGDTVQVPIHVLDVSGTLVDGDAGLGRTIQDLSLVVQVSPPAAVTSVTFLKAGVLVGPTPRFEQPLSFGTQGGILVAYAELGDPISFTLDAPAPGDVVGLLEIEIAPGFIQGTINLDLVAEKTALGNQSGSLVEKPVDGRLKLNHGSVLVDQSIFIDGFESGDTSAWSATIP